MAEERRYTPIYRDIRDETELWSDDQLLAWFVRLRLGADLVYPEAADLPRRIPDEVVEKMVGLGKIMLVTDDTYRACGVDMDRTRKSDIGRANAEARWRGHAKPVRRQSKGNATALPTRSNGNATETETDTETEIESVEQSYSRAKSPVAATTVTGFTRPFRP